jgi:hypothetical protein
MTDDFPYGIEPARKPGVYATLEVFEKELDELHKAIETHAARLQPVLSEVNRVPPGDSPPLVTNCSLAQRIGELTLNLEGAIEKLRALTSRLEI